MAGLSSCKSDWVNKEDISKTEDQDQSCREESREKESALWTIKATKPDRV